jgi:predicted dehydrogenase
LRHIFFTRLLFYILLEIKMCNKFPIQTILIGAGQRGADAYGPYALQHPDEIKFVAVAEPNPQRRARFAEQHNISPELQFEDWEPLLAKPQLGEAALICTQDQQHTAPTLAALKAGYDVLLEKPMATTLEDCQKLVRTAEETNRQLHICHVLRYTSHFSRLREVIQSGVLGQIANVHHRENVSFWHMAHSFVRGNWRNMAASSPMILAKCCHDLDILIWLLDDRCQTLSSVGSLLHYRPENAPVGATKRCTDGCPAAESCPFYAPRIYLEMEPIWKNEAAARTGFERWALQNQVKNPPLIKALSRAIPKLREITEYHGWPRSVITDEISTEGILTALQEGPYGRCVYYCDNDVVDHQVVSMQFEGGTSVTLTMHGHSYLEGRSTRIEGSKATLFAYFGLDGDRIEVHDHRSGQKTAYDTRPTGDSGHGGGDFGLIAAFVRALHNEGAGAALTTARISLESHLMAFAAEDARLGEKVIRMEDYRL